jgi:hypothetical protein
MARLRIIAFLLAAVWSLPGWAQSTPIETYSYGSGAASAPYSSSLYILAAPSPSANSLQHIPANVFATLSDTQTLINKTLSCSSNTCTNIPTSALIGTLLAAQFPALAGDVTTVAGSLTTTLATVNSNVGTFTNATVTANAKGQITAISSGSGGGGSPGGSNGQTQYNNSGSFGGYTPTGGYTVNPATGAVTLGSPGPSTLGGIESTVGSPNEWISSISTSGVPGLSQPAASNLSNGTTGSGAVVLATSPTLVTPALGTPSALVLTNATGLPTAGILGSAVTYAKIQNETAQTVLCNPTGSAAAPSECTLGTNLSFSGSAINASGGGASIGLNRITTGATNTLASITTSFTTENWVSATASAKTDSVPGCASGINGDYLLENDGQGTGGTYPITVVPASGSIGPTGASSYIVTSNYGAALFQCDGTATTWRLVAGVSPGSTVRANTSTSLTVLATDNNNVISQNNAGAVAATIAAANTTGFPENGYSTIIQNIGAGAVTLTPTTSTINGASSIVIPGGSGSAPTGLLLFADGTGNYVGLLFGSGSGGAVSSVTNSDGSLTFSPTTGAVVGSVNEAHPYTWTGNNNYSGKSTFAGSLFVPTRVVTTSGTITVSTTTDYMIIVNKGTPAATPVDYTCSPGFTFIVKDGAGNDATDHITLTPSSGTIDGAATFIMDGSTSGTPPYEARAVTCDVSGNSWVN